LKERKVKGKKGKEIFCYVCKKYIHVTGTKELTPEAQFKNGGHYDEPTHALAPNDGRNRKRYQKALKMKEVTGA
jgi:hypothetical protein